MAASGTTKEQAMKMKPAQAIADRLAGCTRRPMNSMLGSTGASSEALAAAVIQELQRRYAALTKTMTLTSAAVLTAGTFTGPWNALGPIATN